MSGCDRTGMLICMRTTINLPDALTQAAKRRAAEEGRTFTSIVEEGLRTVLEARPERHPAPELPAYGDPSGRFLVDPSDRVAVWQALDVDGAR
jgi:plasmid stability protein